MQRDEFKRDAERVNGIGEDGDREEEGKVNKTVK